MNGWKIHEEINNTTEKVYIPLAFNAKSSPKKRICKTMQVCQKRSCKPANNLGFEAGKNTLTEKGLHSAWLQRKIFAKNHICKTMPVFQKRRCKLMHDLGFEAGKNRTSDLHILP